MLGPAARVAERYTAQTHVEVHIFVAPPDGIRGLLKHRARDDVVVADQATIQALADGKLVTPETVVKLGSDPYVLIGEAGQALPPETSASQLVATHPTVLPDPTTASSFDGTAILHTALPAAAPANLIGVADTVTVVETVRTDAKLVGLVAKTEARSPGVHQLAVLDVPPSIVKAGLVAKGQSANAASFLAFLAGPAGKAELASAGLETP